MSTEKKIIFSGQDSGASQTAHKIYSGILADAQKYSNIQKEQLGYINQQIKALEKKAALETKEGSKVIQEHETRARLSRSTQERERHLGRKTEAEKTLSESTEVLESLKNLLSESRKQTSLTEKLEKDTSKKIRGAEDQYQAFRSLARQEVKENREGVVRKIKEAEKNKYEGLDPRQVEKLMYQKTLLPSERNPQSAFGQIFAGVLAAGVVQKIASSLGQIVGAQSGEQGINTLLGGVPLLGGFLSGGAQRSFEERYAIQTKESELEARTGRRVKGISTASNIGFSSRESLGLTEGLIEASGKSTGGDNTQNAMLLQRALGLSSSTIIQAAKDIRISRSSADLVQIVSEVFSANPDLRKDRTKLAEVLSQSSQLTSQLAQQTENVNLGRNLGMVGALRSIGGSFGDPLLGTQKMMSINQSLTNPSTEYQKARNFGVLSGVNPGSSWFQINEQMEQGIGAKGFLGGVLRQLKREGGGDEGFMTGVQQNLGLGFSASRKLTEAFNKNPTMFDNFAGGNQDLAKLLGVKSLTGEAERLTKQTDKEKADTDNAFAISAAAGDFKIAALTLKAGAEMINNAASKIDKSLSLKQGATGSTISNGINPALGAWYNIFNTTHSD